jgi:enoyl-CoA hydratase/carnithine racemase
VFTGQTIGGAEAAAIGFIDRVVPHEELDAAVRETIASGTRASDRPALGAKHAVLEAFFAGADPDALRRGEVDTKGDEGLAKAARRVASKAPVALRLAARLIDDGAKVTLSEGLAMELAQLETIFRTKDAHEGLSSLGKKAPVFEGR